MERCSWMTGRFSTIEALEKKGFKAPLRFSMHRLLDRHSSRCRYGKPLCPPSPLVELEGVEIIEKFGVMNMDVVGVSPDDGAVFLVHLLDFQIYW